MLARPAFDPDAFERRRARTFLWCGVIFGGALGALLGLRYFLDLHMAGVAGVTGAVLLGWASYRWGDPAWEWFLRCLGWLL